MSDDYSKRAAIGQAYNLAAQESIHSGRVGDMRFLVERFIFHFETAAIFQKTSIIDLANIADREDLLEKFKELHNELNQS